MNGLRLVREGRGNVGRHTLMQSQEEPLTGLVSARKRHSRPHPGRPTAPQPSPIPIPAAAAPGPAELRTRSRSGREWARAAPPPRQIDRRLDQSLPWMLPSNQSAHPRGGAPLTSRPLLASMGPAAAVARGPDRRSPPVGAMLRLVLAVAAMLVVVLLRRRPRRPPRWPPHCCLTVVRHLERGLRACRTPATKRAAIGR